MPVNHHHVPICIVPGLITDAYEGAWSGGAADAPAHGERHSYSATRLPPKCSTVVTSQLSA